MALAIEALKERTSVAAETPGCDCDQAGNPDALMHASDCNWRVADSAALNASTSVSEPPQHLIDLAVQVSGWSPCRSKRGSVIFDRDGNVIAHGHNYKPQGFECDGSEACKATCRVEAIHAEQRALLEAGSRARGAEMLHVKSVDGKLVPSDGPSCVQCSKLGLAAGVRAMWLYHENGWRRYPTDEWHRLSLAALLRARSPQPEQVPASLKSLWLQAVQRALADSEEREAYDIFAELLAASRPASVSPPENAEKTEPNLRRDLTRLLDNLYGLHLRPGHIDAIMDVINLHAPVKVPLTSVSTTERP
jgi:deoxycytidylate deaminase